jgi:starch phosphorylase
MKAELIALCPQFSINRMVREYATEVYFPLFTRQKLFIEKDAQRAKEMAAWKQELQRAWSGVSIDSVEAGSPEQLQVGDELKVTALVQLNALKTDDVSVQIYHGQIDSYGDITDGEVIPMKFTGYGKGTLTPYEGTIKYFKSGRHGFTVRVLPHHADLSSPFETGLVHWAAEPVNVRA